MAAIEADIKAIVGLGNPGEKYDQTRHNAGFWFIDALADQHSARFAAEKKFSGDAAKIHAGARDVWLLKPMTYMNESGRSVKSLLSFYRIEPENMLVVHDEIDLPPGEIRLKTGGGHGGHNGLRNIIDQLGTRDFLRLRVGVGHPGHKDQVVGFVLQRPPKSERILVDDAMDRALRVMPDLLDRHLEQAMMTLHSR